VVTVNVALPAAPSNVQVTAVASGNNATVTLTWTDNANNESGFTVQRASDAAFTQGLNTNNVAANSTIRIETRNRNRAIYYRIRAVNVLGDSGWVNATPFPIVTP
jgi:predicted phage tail protein